MESWQTAQLYRRLLGTGPLDLGSKWPEAFSDYDEAVLCFAPLADGGVEAHAVAEPEARIRLAAGHKDELLFALLHLMTVRDSLRLPLTKTVANSKRWKARASRRFGEVSKSIPPRILAGLGISADEPDVQPAESLVNADGDLLDQLISLRKVPGLSHQNVADRMGISAEAVARIEGERDAYLSPLRRYACAVGARVEHSVVADGGFGG